MKTEITAYVSANHDLVHTSLLLTGLCAVEREGFASVRFTRGGEPWLANDPVVVCLDVRGPLTARIAVDLRDGEGVSHPIIDHVQWYVKRAFYPVEVQRLPPALAAKVRPFGLNYGCRSGSSTLRMLAAVGVPILARGRAGLSRLRQYFTVPAPSVFEQEPSAAVEPWVTFQTRLWTRDEVPAGEADVLNEGRVALVRALRRAFGDRFVGGLVPTAFARQHYPDDLTPHSSRYVEYLALRKRCLIGVYSRGVEHSLAFKLGETFAASQCLVSEPLRYGLPAPLEPGVHYSLFETPQQCIAECQRLFDSPALADAMRRANHDYYRREIEPGAHVHRMLERLR